MDERKTRVRVKLEKDPSEMEQIMRPSPLPKEAQFKWPYQNPRTIDPLYKSMIRTRLAEHETRQHYQDFDQNKLLNTPVVPYRSHRTRPPLAHVQILLDPREGITTNNPLWQYDNRPVGETPLPDTQSSSVLPIISHQPGPPHIESHYVKYLNQNDEVRDECLLDNVAIQIPQSRLFSSSVDAQGKFIHPCPPQEAVHAYRLWPF